LRFLGYSLVIDRCLLVWLLLLLKDHRLVCVGLRLLLKTHVVVIGTVVEVTGAVDGRLKVGYVALVVLLLWVVLLVVLLLVVQVRAAVGVVVVVVELVALLLLLTTLVEVGRVWFGTQILAVQRLLLVVGIVVRRGGEFDVVLAVVVLRLLLLLRVHLLLLHLLLLLGTRIVAWKVAASWASATPISVSTSTIAVR